MSDRRFQRFSESYEARFGTKPYRLATLGYDAVLLTLRIARDWRVGSDFPVRELYDRGGFLGVDGAFRFGRDGVAERALEVNEVRGRQVIQVRRCPDHFRRVKPAETGPSALVSTGLPGLYLRHVRRPV